MYIFIHPYTYILTGREVYILIHIHTYSRSGIQARGCVGGAEYIDICMYVYTYIHTFYPGDRRAAVSEAWMAYAEVDGICRSVNVYTYTHTYIHTF